MSIPVTEPKQIQEHHLSRHLKGIERIGFYNLLPDSKVRWAVVEFEAHGSKGVTSPTTTSIRFMGLLEEAGIRAYRERSKSGGENYHVWVFFEEPIPAVKVRRLLAAVLRRMGLADDNGPKVEVFPPRDYAEGTIGTFVWLPFFGGTDRMKDKKGLGVRQDCTVFIDKDGKSIQPAEFVATAKKNPRSAVNEALSHFGVTAPRQRPPTGGRSPIRMPEVASESELLAPLLKNCPRVAGLLKTQKTRSQDQTLPPEQRGIGWDEWRALIGLLCHFGKVGERLIHRFSSLSPKYDSRATQAQIDDWRGKGIPPASCTLLGCNRNCFPKPSPVRWVFKAKYEQQGPGKQAK